MLKIQPTLVIHCRSVCVHQHALCYNDATTYHVHVLYTIGIKLSVFYASSNFKVIKKFRFDFYPVCESVFKG